MIKRLSELEKGDRASISRIEARGELNRRLRDMGLVPGSPVELIRVAPLGDPIEVRIKGYYLSLRKAEAENIYVDPVRNRDKNKLPPRR